MERPRNKLVGKAHVFVGNGCIAGSPATNIVVGRLASQAPLTRSALDDVSCVMYHVLRHSEKWRAPELSKGCRRSVLADPPAARAKAWGRGRVKPKMEMLVQRLLAFMFGCGGSSMMSFRLAHATRGYPLSGGDHGAHDQDILSRSSAPRKWPDWRTMSWQVEERTHQFGCEPRRGHPGVCGGLNRKAPGSIPRLRKW